MEPSNRRFAVIPPAIPLECSALVAQMEQWNLSAKSL